MSKFDKVYKSIIKEDIKDNIVKEYRVKKTFDCKGFEDWCKKKLSNREHLYCSLRDGTIYVCSGFVGAYL